MSRMLIGLHAKAGSGKDTLFDLMHDVHPGLQRMAFADPLKRAAGILFGWEDKPLFSNEFKQFYDHYWGLSVRDAYQRLGTEAIRDVFDKDFWVKRLMLDYQRTTADVVITDVRFDNEADMIRSSGGQVLHLVRPGAGLKDSEGEHASEAGILWHEDDFVILNDGTLADLAERAKGFLIYMQNKNDNS